MLGGNVRYVCGDRVGCIVSKWEPVKLRPLTFAVECYQCFEVCYSDDYLRSLDKRRADSIAASHRYWHRSGCKQGNKWGKDASGKNELGALVGVNAGG